MDTQTVRRLQDLGRRCALKLGCDPRDGAQEAVCMGLEAVRSSRGTLTEGVIVRRVHDRLLGRWSRLRKGQPLQWEGVFVPAAGIESVGDSEALTAECRRDDYAERPGRGCKGCDETNRPTYCPDGCPRA